MSKNYSSDSSSVGQIHAVEPTDAEYLADFLQGSQPAFAALARRYADLVYAVALRRVRNAAAADDVTQAVFMILARKAASLRGRATLGGWLLVTTRQVASTANRAAARRAKYEHQAAQEADARTKAQIDRDTIAALDDAILRLGGKERDLLTLRFFQNKSMAAVGETFGIGEDAARKRVERALDKLRRILGRRGVAIPAGGIAAIATASLTSPAPAAVVQSAAIAPGVAMSSLAKGTIAMAMLKSAIAAAATVAVVGTVGTVAVVVAKMPETPLPAPQALVLPAVTPPASAPATLPSNLITGRVTAADGKPVDGAFVTLKIDDPKSGEPIAVESVKTDSNGMYRIAISLPDGLTRGAIFADLPGVGFAKRQIWQVGKSVDLKFATPGESRFVLKTTDGKPLAGVQVWPRTVNFPSTGGIEEMLNNSIFAHDDSLKRWAATSNTNGEVVIRGLPAAGQSMLNHGDARFARFRGGLDEQVPVEAAIGGPKTIRMFAAATIDGRLVYADSGKPRANERVYASSLDTDLNQSGGEATTDNDGRFSIGGLKPGSFFVMLDSSHKEDGWCAAAAQVDVLEGQQASAQLKLIHGGLITGRVRSAVTKEGLPTAAVGLKSAAHPDGQGSVQSASVAADGAYSLRVPPGPVQLYLMAQPTGYAPPAVGNPSNLAKANVADGKTTTFDFDLMPLDSPVVIGKVVDTAGKPVADAVVSWEEDDSTFGNNVVTDKDGQFRATVKKSKTVLRARAGNLATLAAVQVKRNSGPVTLTVSDAARFDLHVAVTDEAGAPLPTATVSLSIFYSNFGTGGPDRPVDPKGAIRFEQLFKDSNYTVNVAAPGFGGTQQRLKLPKDVKEPLRISIRLPRTDQQIAGVVVDGEDVATAGVTVGFAGDGAGQNQQTTTDAQGRFSFAVPKGMKGQIYMPQLQNFSSVVAKAGQTDLKIVLTPEAFTPPTR